MLWSAASEDLSADWQGRAQNDNCEGLIPSGSSVRGRFASWLSAAAADISDFGALPQTQQMKREHKLQNWADLGDNILWRFVGIQPTNRRYWW